MTEIDRINDKFFKKTFSDLDNTRAFLKIVLPEPLRKATDFSKIEIDTTNYVSNRFKESFSDAVVKTKIKTTDEKAKELDADIYILLEHKCYRDVAIFIQLLRYMYLMWQKDMDEKKPLRLIIPVVFYHGKEKWNIPRSFIEQFNVSDEIKKFLLNYRYILFDTRDWDFRDKRNEELKDNVFLLTALALMKSVGNEEFEPVREIFKFWHEKGFTREKDKILFFLMYISETKDIDPDRLKKILEDTKIRGGDIMPTLAQRLRNEGKEQWMKEEKIETARRMLNDNVSIENIVKYTGLTEQEVRALMH